MFMLESRLSTDQNRALAAVESAAASADVGLFLTGGAVRDLLGHFQIVDLDFTVAGNPLKVVKDLLRRGAKLKSEDTVRKVWELEFPGPVPVEIAMARTEKYSKPGGKPQVAPAQIYDDLSRRDFTINALAISLNKNSRGLPLDPTNGRADLDAREIRATSNYVLYDDPARILRLIRFQARFGFTVDDRTRNQLENARQAGMISKIPADARRRELCAMAEEPNVAELLRLLETEKLLEGFHPALAGGKSNSAGLTKLQKAKQQVPFGLDLHTDHLALFLTVLAEKLNPKERSQLAKNCGLNRKDVDHWLKVEKKAKAAERMLKGAKLQRPSALYAALSEVPGEQILYLLMHSDQRLVLDRCKNFLQKYAPAAAEVTDAEVTEATGIAPGANAFAKAKREYINKKLDSRPKKVVEEAPPVPEPPPSTGRLLRRTS